MKRGIGAHPALMKNIVSLLTILRTHQRTIISGVILAGTLIGSYRMLTSLTTSRKGEPFEPHDIARTLSVSPEFSYTQTFIGEYNWLHGVRLLVAEPAPGSRVQLQVRHGPRKQVVVVRGELRPASGELFVPLPEPLFVGTKTATAVTLVHVSGPEMKLRFQINERPRPRGELIRIPANTQEYQPHHGHLAFRLQYHATLAEQLGIAAPSAAAVSIALAAVWALYRYQRPAARFLPPLRWQRRDSLLLALPAVLVVGIYARNLWPRLGQPPLMHDFMKDTLYLDTSVQDLRSGVVPYWMHATCGGQPLLGNPESNIIGLGTLVTPLTGPVIGLKLMLLFEIGLIAAGAYVLSRQLGISPLGAGVAALILPLSGFVANRLFLGHTNFIGGLAYLPWLAVSFLHGLEHRRSLIFAALLASLTLWRGSLHMLAYGLILLGLWSLCLAWQQRTVKPLLALAITGGLFIAFSLPRLLPIVMSAEHFQGAHLPQFFVPLASRDLFDDVFLDASTERPEVDVVYGENESWENIGLYVGPLAAVLAGVGLIFAPRPAKLLLGTAVVIFLVLGEGTLYDQVLRHVPYLGSLLRLPSRVLIVVVLAGSVAAGFVVDRLVRGRFVAGYLVAAGLLTAVVADMGSYTRELVQRSPFAVPRAVTSAPYTETRQHDADDLSRHALAIIASGATVPGLCLDFNTWPPFNTNIDAPLVTDEFGRPVRAVLSANQITIPDPPPPPATLFLRAIDSPLLSVAGGYQLVTNAQGQLPVVVNSERPVVLTYQSPVFWPGLVLALGMLGAVTVLPKA